MKVNSAKTKVLIFSKKKINKNNFEFYYKGEKLEIVDEYNYLGLLFNYNGSFIKAKKKLIEQSQKALFGVFQRIRNLCIPIDLQLKIYDSLVLPILLYSSEIWGFENLKDIERAHLQFCKSVLKVRKSTPNYMVYGELGRIPIEIHVKLKMLSFWTRLLYTDKLSSNMYLLMHRLYSYNQINFKWMSFVEKILNEIGLSYIFMNQVEVNWTCLKFEIKQRLTDQFIQKWYSDALNSSRGEFYLSFKKEFKFEPYLTKLNQKSVVWVCKFRTCNIKTPFEVGRWYNVPRDQRSCKLCTQGIGDEYHYLFECLSDEVVKLRKKYIPTYYINNPNKTKMGGMFSNCHVQLLGNIAVFIKCLVKLL